MEFAIKPCQVGDERRLSLLGKATLLETYAGNTEAADLLDFAEAEHSAELYKFWLDSDFAKIWIAETIPAHSAVGYAVALPSHGDSGVEIKRLYVLHRFQQNGLGHRLMNEILDMRLLSCDSIWPHQPKGQPGWVFTAIDQVQAHSL